MRVVVTPTFNHAAKKLLPNQKKSVDLAVQAISKDPYIGEQKAGNLSHIFIYKFKVLDQQWLMAYRFEGKKELRLLTLGSHENFYKTVRKIRFK